MQLKNPTIQMKKSVRTSQNVLIVQEAFRKAGQKYKEESEIIRIKTNERITFLEARRKYRLTHPVYHQWPDWLSFAATSGHNLSTAPVIEPQHEAGIPTFEQRRQVICIKTFPKNPIITGKYTAQYANNLAKQ